MRGRLEQYFEFARLGTNWRTEILAGCTTFLTMAYIVFVNPAILSETGMPLDAVTLATCVSAAFGSVLMGVIARYPIALAPGMGLNAYFTYVVVKGMGVGWQVALGAVFLSGVAFFLLTLLGIRQMVVSAIPRELFAAVAAGIGLFIAFIGLKNSGVVVASPATFVTLGNLRDPSTALALLGLIAIAAMLAARLQAAMLIGVLGITAVAAAFGSIQWKPRVFDGSQAVSTIGKLDLSGALSMGLAEIVFVFLFVDLFDNVGTLLAVGKKAGLFVNQDQIPRLNQILFADSAATIAGSLTGTSTVVSYIESAAGVTAGGRSGVTAIVAGLLFLPAMILAPWIGAIPAAATAPALVIVGSLMASHAAEIRWEDPEIGVPAFLTLITIPLTFSIANGLALGFVSYTLLRMMRGKLLEIPWFTYLLTILFLARFLYLGKG